MKGVVACLASTGSAAGKLKVVGPSRGFKSSKRSDVVLLKTADLGNVIIYERLHENFPTVAGLSHSLK